MVSPIPSVKAQTQTEISDSCNCSSTCCWGRKKPAHRPRSTEKKVKQVAEKVIDKST